jgi:hypothetical protein
MTHYNIRRVLGATLFLSLSSVAAHAQPCSNSTLSGGYSYQVVGQDGAAAPFQPFAAERLVTFDGKGNLSGNGYRVLAGVGAETSVTGTYSVRSDCSVTFDITVLGADNAVKDRDKTFGVITEAGKKTRLAKLTAFEWPAMHFLWIA